MVCLFTVRTTETNPMPRMTAQQQLTARVPSKHFSSTSPKWSRLPLPPRTRSPSSTSARHTHSIQIMSIPGITASSSFQSKSSPVLVRRHGGDRLSNPCRCARESHQSWTTSLRSSIRQQLRSVHQERQRLLPMCSLFFLMAFINTLINNLALSLVMTSTGGGAVVIPFLNVYGVLPASLAFTLCYAYAAHHVTRDKLFNFVIATFAIFVLGFTYVLYPNHTSLHLHGFSDMLSQVLPSGFAGGIGMIRNWTFALFYCVSELWGDVGLSLLFWGFANEITHVDRAPLLYPLFGVGANLAQILGGIVLRMYSTVEFTVSFKAMTIQMVGCMVIVVALHQWIADDARKKAVVKRRPNNEHRLRLNGSNVSFANGAYKNLSGGHVMQASWRSWKRISTKPTQNDRNKKSFRQSLQTLSECPQIRCLAIMTVAQGLSVTLMEFLWKYHLRLAYPTPEAFTGFLGDVSTATGFVTGFLMLTSPLLFQHMKWREVASITPRVFKWGGIFFFASCLLYNFSSHLQRLSFTQMMVAPIVFGGAILYVLSRGSKFSLFKPAEEMVYLTLDLERRTKGKAAVDVVGTQIGKSGGSIMQQLLLMLSGGRLLTITPAMVVAYFYMLSIWKKAVNEIALHRQFSDVGYDKADKESDNDDTMQILNNSKLIKPVPMT